MNTHWKTQLGCWLGSVLVVQVCLAQARSDSLPDAVDQASLEAWQYEIAHQKTVFASAYGLDIDAQTALHNELQRRLIEQVAFDRQLIAFMQKKSEEVQAAGLEDDENSADGSNIAAEIVAFTQNAPLNEERVADWLEQAIPAKVASEGRLRMRELLELRMKTLDASSSDLGVGPQAKSELAASVVAATTPIAPHDDLPLPNDPANDRYYTEIRVREAGGEVIVAPGRKGSPVSEAPMPGEMTKAERMRQAEIEAAEREGRRKPGPAGLVSPSHEMTEAPAQESIVVEQPPAPQVTVQVAPTTPTGQPAGRLASQEAAKEVVYAAAPPLDDWDKYVQEHAKKVGFDDAQMTRAQAVLKDLKRRANQYRMSRSDLFAAAALKTDAKARDAMMKDLNKPIDAMFEELKQRVDSLMTLEQREKMKAGKTKK